MALLAKPVNNIVIIQAEDTEKFVKRFNQNKVNKDFLECEGGRNVKGVVPHVISLTKILQTPFIPSPFHHTPDFFKHISFP